MIPIPQLPNTNLPFNASATENLFRLQNVDSDPRHFYDHLHAIWDSNSWFDKYPHQQFDVLMGIAFSSTAYAIFAKNTAVMCYILFALSVKRARPGTVG